MKGGFRLAEATFQVRWAHGLHLRRAAEIVQTVKAFQAKVSISANGKSVEARSPLALMTLNAVQGTVLAVQAEGPDADMAVRAVGEVLAQEKE